MMGNYCKEDINAKKVIVGIGIYIITLGFYIQAYADSVVWPIIGERMQLGNSFTLLMVISSPFSAAATPIAAKICAKGYQRQAFWLSSSIFTVATVSLIFVHSLVPLLLLKALIGINIAFFFTSSLVLIGDIFGKEKRGFWLGLTGTVMGIASIVSPVLSGYISDLGHPEYVFLLIIPFFAVGFIMTCRMPVKVCYKKESGSIDLIGAVFICFFLVSLFLLSTLSGKLISPSNPVFWLMCTVMAVSFVIFVTRESKMKEKALFPLSIFADRNFRNIALGTFFASAAAVFPYYLLANFMVNELHTTSLQAGIAVSLQFLIALFCSTKLGKYYSRKNEFKKSIIISGIVLVVIYLLFIRLPHIGSIVLMIYVAMVLFGTYAMVSTVFFPYAAQNYVDEHIRPYSVGTVHLCQSLGYSMPMSFFTLFINNSAWGYTGILVISIILTCITVFISCSINND